MGNGIERFYLERGESSGEQGLVGEGGLRERPPREGAPRRQRPTCRQ